MEEAAELGNYLPLSFKTPKEQEYIEFLWDAFETNYTHGKYQFAFLAYHMLTMSFVYFNIWQIRQARPEDFEKGLIGFGKDIEKSLLGATSPFVFSTVKESSILRLLKLIACDNGKIGTYAKLVNDRNETAHPNGNIFFSTQAALDSQDRRNPSRGGRNPDPLQARHRTRLPRVPASEPRPRRTRIPRCRRPDP